MGNSRDIRIDLMRGVGILLMVIGHFPVGAFTHQLIYSFHMPLFFIVSGYLTKDFSRKAYTIQEVRDFLFIKLIRRLITPAITTIVAIVILKFLTGQPISHITGPLWFLFAMFWTKLAFRFIQPLGKWALPTSLTVGFIAYIISHYWLDYRTFFIQGLCALPFVAIGNYIKQRDAEETRLFRNKIWILACISICFICWVLSITYFHVDTYNCSCGCWPIDIIGACGGTFAVGLLVNFLVKHEKIADTFLIKAVAWCGKYSLAILCMHGLEMKALLPLEQSICSGWLLLVVRFIITIVLSVIVVYAPGVKRIYK